MLDIIILPSVRSVQRISFWCASIIEFQNFIEDSSEVAGAGRIDRRLEQVLENLLSNAIKYGEGKSISVQLVSEPAHALLIVKDHGNGIAREFLPRIFDRFERWQTVRYILQVLTFGAILWGLVTGTVLPD